MHNDKNSLYPDFDFGSFCTEEHTTFKVYATECIKVSVIIFNSFLDTNPVDEIFLNNVSINLWLVTLPKCLENLYYNYKFYRANSISIAPDIYAKACSPNGLKSFICDLSDTNPESFKNYTTPNLRSYTDAFIYELHIRDFSIDNSGNFINKGKYLAFTETPVLSTGEKIGLQYIKDLGITHIHLLPTCDFESIDELSHIPQYNWGYDPQSFFIPEGSYSSDVSDPLSRIKEFKLAVNAIHNAGLGVIMDMVYNHTYKAEDSAFQIAAPDVFYRKSDNKFTNGSGCGNELNSTHPIVRKHIIDSLIFWASEYKIDGFRFDLMGLIDIETMNIAEKALHNLNPNIILYGEGWIGGNSSLPTNLQCIKSNAKYTSRIAYFSDNIRDSVKGSVFISSDKAFVNGNYSNKIISKLKDSIMGKISFPTLSQSDNSTFAISPEQTVNYVEAHDNLTLFDKLSLSCENYSLAKIKYADRLAAAIVILSQGIPFIQAGQEFLRSKPLSDGGFSENSYNLPDSVNSLKWNLIHQNLDTVNYYKGLISFRKTNPLLRLKTAEEVNNCLSFIKNLPEGVIAFSLSSYEHKEIIIAFNPTDIDVSINLKGKYNLFIDKYNAGNVPLSEVNNSLNIKSLSAVVIKKVIN